MVYDYWFNVWFFQLYYGYVTRAWRGVRTLAICERFKLE